jgi:acetyl esterase/lipase
MSTQRVHLVPVVLLVLGAGVACRSGRDSGDEDLATPTWHKEPAPPAAPMEPREATAPRSMTLANPEMRAVLAKHEELGAQPIERLRPIEARLQPTPADAVEALLAERGEPTKPAPGVRVENRSMRGPGGELPVRIYRPERVQDEPFPVIVYFHGGGWVIADLDTYDATPRALARGANAIVVSAHYRQAPEHRFPAAHDDALAAWRWARDNGGTFGGDPRRMAIAGESAGGNMALSTALELRDEREELPAHVLLIYPVTSTSLDWPSVEEHAHARPLNKAMLPWFLDKYAPDEKARSDPRLDVLSAELHGLPPTTVITAEIDPLRSEGEALVEQLGRAGVRVAHRNYRGVTHEFFGMDAVLDAARQAQAFAAERLGQALESRR